MIEPRRERERTESTPINSLWWTVQWLLVQHWRRRSNFMNYSMLAEWTSMYLLLNRVRLYTVWDTHLISSLDSDIKRHNSWRVLLTLSKSTHTWLHPSIVAAWDRIAWDKQELGLSDILWKFVSGKNTHV